MLLLLAKFGFFTNHWSMLLLPVNLDLHVHSLSLWLSYLATVFSFAFNIRLYHLGIRLWRQSIPFTKVHKCFELTSFSWNSANKSCRFLKRNESRILKWFKKYILQKLDAVNNFFFFKWHFWALGKIFSTSDLHFWHYDYFI